MGAFKGLAPPLSLPPCHLLLSFHCHCCLDAPPSALPPQRHATPPPLPLLPLHCSCLHTTPIVLFPITATAAPLPLPRRHCRAAISLPLPLPCCRRRLNATQPPLHRHLSPRHPHHPLPRRSRRCRVATASLPLPCCHRRAAALLLSPRRCLVAVAIAAALPSGCLQHLSARTYRTQ